uniref:Uncharacterized protein n=1 Tax=Zooxanthella nutricula TaxID=1333877 RepID=A0A7S2N260_9DINO
MLEEQAKHQLDLDRHEEQMQEFRQFMQRFTHQEARGSSSARGSKAAQQPLPLPEPEGHHVGSEQVGVMARPGICHASGIPGYSVRQPEAWAPPWPHPPPMAEQAADEPLLEPSP